MFLYHASSYHNCYLINRFVVVSAGENDIPGLTDNSLPKRLGPKRASKIRKLFMLSPEDDVRKYVVRRPLPQKEGKYYLRRFY